MRVLNSAEIEMVSGGSDIDPMDIAISYSSTVISAAIGFSVAGPVGGLIGAAVGFTAGTAMTIGYSLATGGGGLYRDDLYACHMS
ncbi:MAG: hypothetical protein Q7W55_15905 [Pseudohongiella sp.]|nr:hypothetical protein [Pseudohongiella sp.]